MEQNQYTQTRTLAELEHIVDKGKATFIEVGEALAEIREGQLYKPLTWSAYVQGRFGFTRQYAHRLIKAMEWSKEMSTVVDIPKTEHAAKEARKRAAEKRSKAKQSKPEMPLKLATVPAKPLKSWEPPTVETASLAELFVESEVEKVKKLVAVWRADFSEEDFRKLLTEVIWICEEIVDEFEEGAEEKTDEVPELEGVAA